MANRSYLYAVDTPPAPRGKAPKPIRSVSEFGWDVPLAHRILVSNAPRLCRSVIWREHTIGIVAEAEGSVALLREFLGALGASGKVKKAKAFAAEVQATHEFLADEKNLGKYFLLEAGEILELADGELAEAADTLLAELSGVRARVQSAIAGNEPGWLEELRKDWAPLGLDGWSDVLYYSFD